MPTFYFVRERPVLITADEAHGSARRVTHHGFAPAYYKAKDETVSAANNDGTLDTGKAIDVTVPTWFRSNRTGARLMIVDL